MDVGLRQGSALNPRQGSALSPLSLLVISRKASTRDILRKLIFTDDLAVVADSEADLQGQLVEWKEIFGRHGLRVSLEKTAVLWVGQQKKDLDQKLNQRDSFVYLGGMVCGDGGLETEFTGEYKVG